MRSEGELSTSVATTRACGGASASNSPAAISAIACGSSTNVGASAGRSRSTGAVGPVGPVPVGPVVGDVVPVGEGSSGGRDGGRLDDVVGPAAPRGPGSASEAHAPSPNATDAANRTNPRRRTAGIVGDATMRPVNEPAGKTVAESQTTLVQLMEIT